MLAHWIRALIHSMLLISLLGLSACSAPPQRFLPVEQRPVSPTQKPWPRNHVLILAYHDVQDSQPDQTFIAVHTHHLAQHFAWLRENGYAPVSVEQIIQARQGGPSLPDKAVLLTFDDGYSSFQTRVLPLLRAYQWPAVLAPVGIWADTPPKQNVNFGGKLVRREHFLDWPAIKDIQASGLVEIAAHSDNLHFGVNANPQGNTQPAAATRIYDTAGSRYESDDAYAKRIRSDARAISEKIRRTTGQRPRVWIWPYGEANGLAIQQLKQQGYDLIMTLDWGLADIEDADNLPRLLVSDDPDLPAFSNTALAMEEHNKMRAVQIKLDQVYDPSPEKTAENLGALVQRIADLKINTVFLTAYSDTDNDGIADQLYFPNRSLPMRSDLFNRAAWQLRTRAGVKVYAEMPLRAFTLDAQGPDHYKRIQEIYEDLARYSNFAGLLINDPLLHTAHSDAVDTLIGEAWHLALKVQALRGPQVQRAIALPVTFLNGASSSAANSPVHGLLAHWDWIAIDASLPQTNATPQTNSLDGVIQTVAKHGDVLDKTVFMVNAANLHAGANGWRDQSISSDLLAQQLVRLQTLGAANMGYIGDDFLNDQPRLDVVRPALSTAWYPYK